MQRKYEYRRKLPHRQWTDKTYFITFATRKRTLLTPRSRDIVLNTCLEGNGKVFELHAAVVMPNHVHLMLTPLADKDGEVSIAEIMQTIKGAGPVWQEESFDRAMREVESVRSKVEY